MKTIIHKTARFLGWLFLAHFFLAACVGGKQVYIGNDENGKPKYATDCAPGECGQTFSMSSNGSSCYNAGDDPAHH